MKPQFHKGQRCYWDGNPNDTVTITAVHTRTSKGKPPVLRPGVWYEFVADDNGETYPIDRYSAARFLTPVKEATWQ